MAAPPFVSTLDSYLRAPYVEWGGTSQYVHHPEFTDLYVRRDTAYVGGQRQVPSITIANIRARRPGTGAWHRLVAELHGTYAVPILVESVLNMRFADTLKTMGFTHLPDSVLPCYWLPLRESV